VSKAGKDRVAAAAAAAERRKHPVFLAATISLLIAWLAFLAWMAFRG
jgi:hypothetical protein